jgi:hypothetical protein
MVESFFHIDAGDEVARINGIAKIFNPRRYPKRKTL